LLGSKNKLFGSAPDIGLGDLGLSFLVLIGGLGGLLLYSAQTPPALPLSPQITLFWDNFENTPGSYITEVWCSSNLIDWTLKAEVSTNLITLPATNAQEFFRIRNRGTNGLLSDWSR